MYNSCPILCHLEKDMYICMHFKLTNNMANLIKCIGLAGICLGAAFSLEAQVTVTQAGQPVARIVLASDEKANREAAELLQDFVGRISGAELPIMETKQVKTNDILIGEPTDQAGEDGFRLLTTDGCLHIQTGGDKGAIYGVVDLLEQELGVSCYTADYFRFEPNPSITIPKLDRSETPAFRYRQTQSYSASDPIYKAWYRLEEPSEEFIGNLWVHTFDRILPAARFGKEHPEYYSFINGERRPGNHSQWCLTNPDVFDAVVHQLDSIFKANPGLKMISISQNDGNNTYCSCEACRKVDEYEGSPSGNIIRFLNKLAAHYPDKEFSTLAYLYSMQPPKHVKPLPNVNIMLCDIDCKREVPLTDNESGRYFMQALEGWSRISNNIYVWDYGINFDNMVAPFPNFHIIQKNIQLFHQHHATMHFSQIGGVRGGDFMEMRAYLVSKLMWNPYQDMDSLMNHFLDGYYGAAAPYMRQYIDRQEGALLASHQPLWIYDSPISHKDGLLCPALMKRYNELFDRAEEVVASDKDRLDHVRLTRLPLQYAELEIARTRTDNDLDEIRTKLDLFHERTAQFGVKTLNERNNPPEEYYTLYKERFLPQAEPSLALGAKVEWILPPAKTYQPIADRALTDGLYGGTTYVESWVGWEGKDAAFILDLGEEKEFTTISADFLHQLGAWILLPKGGTYSVSSDKQTFCPFGSFSFPEDRDGKVKFVKGTASSSTPVKARYIKVEIETLGLCPSWHYGVGYPAWFFLDEVEVH